MIVRVPAVYEHRPAPRKILIDAPAIRSGAAIVLLVAMRIQTTAATARTHSVMLLIMSLVIGLLLLFGAAGPLVSAALLLLMKLFLMIWTIWLTILLSLKITMDVVRI